ncbi:flagellar hook-associated family protein [Acuticoccus sp. I52.16.1]|uniref:flagellar hook-associated family protein n=1 Tax=Acuticoccus sp. I52.16.1 TaxID=2928472 RepID=UPI001FD1BD76|nr:flagellar hook-associated family protein [Acuticoccus sp. I52.16.1]UOM34942.1 flagellar hook-associated family protein [Acuticoccus sp. I52.16.1]
MHTNYVSTAALRNAPRSEIVRLQSELADRTIEIATQRHADVGLALGADTGRTVHTRMDLSLIETLLISNGSATARLEQTQTALADLETIASEMLASLTALPPGNAAATTLAIQADSSLDRFADRLNASDGGSYIFGGQRTDERPLERFDNGPQAAIEAAFLAKFGFPVGDPSAATISVSDMQDFLANEFAAEFDMAAWTANWSNAASDRIVSRISPSERLVSSVTANEDAMRTVAMGFAMIAGLGFESLNQEVRNAVVAEARLVMGEAITQVVSLKSMLGFAENAIGHANERMSLARDILTQKIADLEGADPVEAKVRIDLVTTQIEMSYALTNQLSRLSILNYA